MKRFKLTDPSDRTLNATFDTIEEVVNEIKNNRSPETQTYYIECREDEITVSSQELLEYWNEGERPEDLQMF